MATLTVKAVGDTAILDIADVAIVKGKFDDQACFTTIEGDHLFLPKDTAERQLARLGLDLGTVIGERLKFYRAPNSRAGGAPYWNIDRLEKGAARDVQTLPLPPGHQRDAAPFTAQTRPAGNNVASGTGNGTGLLEEAFKAEVTVLGLFVPLYLAAGATLEQAIDRASQKATSLMIEHNKTHRAYGVHPKEDVIASAHVYVRGITSPKAAEPAKPAVPALLRDDPPPPTDEDAPWMP